jgi:hypothetical protein
MIEAAQQKAGGGLSTQGACSKSLVKKASENASQKGDPNITLKNQVSLVY